MNVHNYLNAEDIMESQRLFASDYTTRELAYVLADQISIRSNSPERIAYLKDFNSRISGWVRGTICRALADEGVTVQLINFRKS